MKKATEKRLISVILSFFISHTAAKTPSSVAALSSGFSAPCSGSRIYTPYISEQSSVTHIVAEYGQDQGIFPILAEQPVTLLQIPYQQFFRFRLRHIIGQFLSRKFTMSVTVVRIIRTVMESLVFLNQLDG